VHREGNENPVRPLKFSIHIFEENLKEFTEAVIKVEKA
jgi:hypothetical protein